MRAQLTPLFMIVHEPPGTRVCFVDPLLHPASEFFVTTRVSSHYSCKVEKLIENVDGYVCLP